MDSLLPLFLFEQAPCFYPGCNQPWDPRSRRGYCTECRIAEANPGSHTARLRDERVQRRALIAERVAELGMPQDVIPVPVMVALLRAW